MLKKTSLLFFTVLIALSCLHIKLKAQGIEILGGNLVNGAVTGTILGAATMGLRNSSDFGPMRIGVGAGILGGAGIAIYDIISKPKNQEFYISGTFNDGNNTSILILLDTFYGAAGGAAIGTAVILLSGDSFADGVRIGSGAGAWTGFAFGLVDAFFLANRNLTLGSNGFLDRGSFYASKSGSTEFDLIKPSIISTTTFGDSGELNSKISPAIQVMSLKVNF